MEHSTNLFYLCVIFTVGAVIAQYFTSGVYNEATTSKNLMKNSTGPPTMFIECETPNDEPGICVNIMLCRKLLMQMMNREAWPFLRASRCGSETGNIPKVCCGQDNNFKNASSNIIKKTVASVVVKDVSIKSCGRQIDFPKGHKIVGGREAFIGEFPWMALILHKNEYGNIIIGCAGFLIHVKYVITAAHCTHANIIKQRGPILSVLLGEHNIQTSTDCSETVCARNTQNMNIDKVITHPDYDPIKTEQYNDIAIIQLKDNASLTDYVQPICLLEDDNQFPVSYFLSGWGRTETSVYSNLPPLIASPANLEITSYIWGYVERQKQKQYNPRRTPHTLVYKGYKNKVSDRYESHSKVKLFVEIPSFSKTECDKKYASHKIILNETQICAGGQQMADSCTGDSGGPLMMSNDNETWFAAGVVSFGMGCGVEGWPGVYTDTVKFLPWIKAQMA